MAVNTIRTSFPVPERAQRRAIGALTLAATVSALLFAPVGGAAAQDAKRGEHVFRKCLLCHVVDPNSTKLIAPPLHNVIGRRAATVPGFSYSEIMLLARDKGLVWNADALYYFLDKPEDFMPGTYMAFAGLDEQERKDVIAYLTKITDNYNAQQRSPAVPFSAPKTMAPIKVEPKGPASTSSKAKTPPPDPKQ